MEEYATLRYRLFKEGDRVMTPDGEGHVIRDEEPAETVRDLVDMEILVQHDEGCSENPSNKPINVERSCVLLLEEDLIEPEDEA